MQYGSYVTLWSVSHHRGSTLGHGFHELQTLHAYSFYDLYLQSVIHPMVYRMPPQVSNSPLFSTLSSKLHSNFISLKHIKLKKTTLHTQKSKVKCINSTGNSRYITNVGPKQTFVLAYLTQRKTSITTKIKWTYSNN